MSTKGNLPDSSGCQFVKGESAGQEPKDDFRGYGMGRCAHRVSGLHKGVSGVKECKLNFLTWPNSSIFRNFYSSAVKG